MEHVYREVRKIRIDDLRNLCIAKCWYTRGGNAAYNHLLNDLARIAVTFFEKMTI